jgi:DNA replication protein DnaC
MPDRDRLRRAVPAIDGTYLEFVEKWLLHGSQLVGIKGGTKSGKTSVSTGIMIEIITRRYTVEFDPMRFVYVNAPSAFAEIARTRFADNNLESFVVGAGLLIIDNIHMLDQRDITKMCAIVMNRCDRAKATIVTMTPTFDGNDPSFQDNLLEGTTVML